MKAAEEETETDMKAKQNTKRKKENTNIIKRELIKKSREKTDFKEKGKDMYKKGIRWNPD
eukprot:11258448-Heterocapsa_arctica.AAC.1